MSESSNRPPPIVEMRHINKSFGAVRALRDVDLSLFPGEILGLVGDNSAGKSTLMKILTGAYQRDTGDILVAGAPVHFKSPHESRQVGIEMIYQDFALCGNMDVGQNIFLGRWPKKGPFIDRKKMYREADVVLKRLKVDVNSVYQRVESLSGGRQQSVAIARAISFEPRVVKTGMRADGYIEIVDGVRVGEEVVVSANFLIDAESNIKAALAGLGGADAGTAKPAMPGMPMDNKAGGQVDAAKAVSSRPKAIAEPSAPPAIPTR